MKRWMVIVVLTASFLICVPGPGSFAGPGSVKIAESKLDKTVQLSLEPGWIYGKYIKIGLYKTSNMATDDLVLSAWSAEAGGFADDESLKIGIDGEIISPQSIDDGTQFDSDGTRIWAFKRYLINRGLVERMVSSEEVIVRITHNNRMYEEGEFHKGGYTTAKNGFKKFLKKMKTTFP